VSDVTIKKLPASQGHSFGPGSLESMLLTTWTNKHGVGKVRLTGWFTAYCGHGNEHSVRIDERGAAADFDGWETWQAAFELISFGLEDWTDQCEDGS
tara:strand:- start:7306 stop:7596 length:291 start_codon:yes stop_codon:yes gene_type:complete